MFAADLSGYPACGGRLRIVAALTDPTSIRTHLEGVGLPAVPPPRPPSQPQFEFAAWFPSRFAPCVVSRTEECTLKYQVDP